MKKLYVFSFLLITIFSAVSAQTLKIAHKSHAGKAATFSPGDFDTFGWVGSTIVSDSALLYEKNPHEKNNTVDPPVTPLPPVMEEHPVIEPIEEIPAVEQITPPPSQPGQPKSVIKGKTKKVKKTRKNQTTGLEEILWEDVAIEDQATDAGPTAQVTDQRDNRMTWLYGIIGLVVLPGLVLASGAFRKSSEKNT